MWPPNDVWGVGFWSAATLPAGVDFEGPRGGAGTIGGIVNLCNDLMGVAAPVITGFTVRMTHSFAGAFLVAGVAPWIGIFSYVVVLGRIEPIAEPKAAS